MILTKTREGSADDHERESHAPDQYMYSPCEECLCSQHNTPLDGTV